MALYTTIHLHNIQAGREAEYATWFDGPHHTALANLRGFVTANRYEIAEAKPEAVNETYVTHTQTLLSEFSQLLRTVADSMAHEGRTDAVESERIRAKWQALQSCAEAFMQACERGNFDLERR